MKFQRLPSLVLALALQVLPVCRVVCCNPATAPAGFALVFRCLAGLGALLGPVNALSGASAPAGIQGVVPTRNGIPVGPVTTNATGGVGVAFIYRIVVTNGLTDHLQDYFRATPLPPGLTIDTNIGASGFIVGTPAAAGVTFPVTLTAGNKIYDGQGGAPVHLDIKITITNTTGTGTAPAITTQPQSRTVTNGDSASFTVVATGSPPPGYQWRKNGAHIAGATSAIYNLAAVTTNDAAGYSVVVSNSINSVTSAVATLTVLVPPSITTEPRSVTVTNGDNATLSVVALGQPPPAYQWWKDGAVLPGATADTYRKTGVTTNDAGAYRVVVFNPAGSVTSAVATVSVVAAGPLTLTNLQLAGASISFDVVGPANRDHVLWRCADLGAWAAILTNFTANGTWHFSETVSAPNEARFYRATASP